MVRLLGLGILWLLGCGFLSANAAENDFSVAIDSSIPQNLISKDSVLDSTQLTSAILRHQFQQIGWTGDLPLRFQQKANRKLFHLSDTASINPVLEKVESYFKEQGYAGASIDTAWLKGDSLQIHFYQGWKFRMDSMNIWGISPEAWQESHLTGAMKKRQVFSTVKTEGHFSSILSYYQNRGYPFAALTKERTEIIPDSTLRTTFVRFQYTLDPGSIYYIDSIILEGKIRENPKFVQNLIRIHPGQLYRYSEIKEIPGILNNSIYYQRVKKPEEIFSQDGKVKLRIPIEARKASRFDGLVGLLPPVDNTAKVQVTGLLDFVLVSPFSSGEILALKFEQLPSLSQRLALKYQQPWLFNLPLKVETELNLLKQDTTFLNRFFKITPSWMLSQRVQIKGWYRNKTSVLLSTVPWRNTRSTPPVLDSYETTLGFGFEYEKLDYRINPSKGFVFRLDAGAGNRTIRRNPGLDSFDYASIQLKYPAREVQLEVQWFFSPINRNVILLANRSFRLDQVQYFRNELAQIGGARSLRGFNENQFFARYYTIFTFEYRFLLDENSNLFVFFDQGRLEWREPGLKEISTPSGIGAGINFDTKAGILNLTFATGKVGDIPFSPSRPRVHFGIVSLF
jgi:outer membrane protein assembly factor BamA